MDYEADINPDLSTVTSDQLIAELASRATAMVVVALIETEEKPVRMRFTGSRLMCRGLVEDLRDYVAAESQRITKEGKQD